MNYLLSVSNQELVAQQAWANTLLAFDYDGTLAPIVADRDRAQMRTTTRHLLLQVAKLYPCVLISGRSVADVSTFVKGIPFRYIVGNHGLEPDGDLRAFERVVRRILPELARAVANLQGVDIEDKHYSLAIHYRRSRRKRETIATILQAIAALRVRTRLVHGKQVINVLPERAPHKGHAVLHLRELLQADTVLYLGDDVTDEDVFAIDQPGQLFSVRVGVAKNSGADFHLRDQSEIDRLLALLIKFRKSGVSPHV